MAFTRSEASPWSELSRPHISSEHRSTSASWVVLQPRCCSWILRSCGHTCRAPALWLDPSSWSTYDKVQMSSVKFRAWSRLNRSVAQRSAQALHIPNPAELPSDRNQTALSQKGTSPRATYRWDSLKVGSTSFPVSPRRRIFGTPSCWQWWRWLQVICWPYCNTPWLPLRTDEPHTLLLILSAAHQHRPCR